VTPKKVSDALLAFPGTVVKDLMVPMEQIPEEFKTGGTKWNRLQKIWFYEGLPGATEFDSKEGVDCATAMRHLMAIQRSYEPKHEHKSACVAYFMSLWFNDIVMPEPEKEEAADGK
jgi:hypothetical protein